MIGLQCLGDVSGKNPLPSAARVHAVAGIEQPSTLSICKVPEGSPDAGKLFRLTNRVRSNFIETIVATLE
jgi:hypothetical protein